jgi:hypothetical protein
VNTPGRKVNHARNGQERLGVTRELCSATVTDTITDNWQRHRTLSSNSTALINHRTIRGRGTTLTPCALTSGNRNWNILTPPLGGDWLRKPGRSRHRFHPSGGKLNKRCIALSPGSRQGSHLPANSIHMLRVLRLWWRYVGRISQLTYVLADRNPYRQWLHPFSMHAAPLCICKLSNTAS